MSFFQRTTLDCKIESFYATGRQKKNNRFSVDGFSSHCNTVFEAMGCFYRFCPCQELRPSLTEEVIKRGSRKRELDELRQVYVQEKGFTVIEMWECEGWRLYKTTINVKLHIRENFAHRRSLTEHQLQEGMKKGNLFRYVECDNEVPENLRANFVKLPPKIKSTSLSKNDIVDLMKTYAEEEGIMSQPRKMLISSCTLQNGTLITPLLLLYLQLGLTVTKTQRFVEYTPKKCFNSLVQSALDARRKSDEKPNTIVVAETMNLLAKCSWPQPTHCNEVPHWRKTQAAINSKLFKKLDHVNYSLYELELAKAQIEHKAPFIVGFFILQYAKLQMLELYHNFFTKLCDVDRFEELEMDTDSPYFALTEIEQENCIKPEMKEEWQRLRSSDCIYSFNADPVANFFPWTCCIKHKQHDKRVPGFFIEKFRFTEMLCLCSKTYCCYNVTSKKLKISSKDLTKRVLEQSGDGPLEKYRRILNKKVHVTWNNRGFRTNNNSVATYEQVKKGLSYFYPKRTVKSDGIHNQPPNL